jgi:hypothetical protein
MLAITLHKYVAKDSIGLGLHQCILKWYYSCFAGESKEMQIT